MPLNLWDLAVLGVLEGGALTIAVEHKIPLQLQPKSAPACLSADGGAGALVGRVQVLEAMVADWAVFVSESTQSMANMTPRAVSTSPSSATSSR